MVCKGAPNACRVFHLNVSLGRVSSSGRAGPGTPRLGGAAILDAPNTGLTLPKGLGTRHWAAAAITNVTNALAVVVSQSTGTVRLFQKGEVILRIAPMRHDRAMKWHDTETEHPPLKAESGRLDRSAFENLIKGAYGITRTVASLSETVVVKSSVSVSFKSAGKAFVLRVVSVNPSKGGDDATMLKLCN